MSSPVCRVGSTVDLSPNRGCAAGSSPGLPPCWPLWRMVGAGRADRCLYAATDTRHRGHERGRGPKTPKHPQCSKARYLGTPVALDVGQRQRVQRETFNVFLDAVHLTRSWTSPGLCSKYLNINFSIPVSSESLLCNLCRNGSGCLQLLGLSMQKTYMQRRVANDI